MTSGIISSSELCTACEFSLDLVGWLELRERAVVKTQQFRHQAFISYEENWASSYGNRRSYKVCITIIMRQKHSIMYSSMYKVFHCSWKNSSSLLRTKHNALWTCPSIDIYIFCYMYSIEILPKECNMEFSLTIFITVCFQVGMHCCTLAN